MRKKETVRYTARVLPQNKKTLTKLAQLWDMPMTEVMDIIIEDAAVEYKVYEKTPKKKK